MATWIFEEVRDWDERYLGWTIKMEDDDLVTSSGFSRQDAELIAKHFGVDYPTELAGKSFENDARYASSAIDLLLQQIRSGGHYTPPTGEEVRHIIFESLAKLEEPDLTKIDGETVYRAIAEIWGDGFGMNVELQVLIQTQLTILSNGKVGLIRATDTSEFPKIKGPAAYLYLITEERWQKLIFGPYSSPVILVR